MERDKKGNILVDTKVGCLVIAIFSIIILRGCTSYIRDTGTTSSATTTSKIDLQTTTNTTMVTTETIDTTKLAADRVKLISTDEFKYAKIELSITHQDLNFDEYKSFCNEVVSTYHLDYFTILFLDSTAICFPNCDTSKGVLCLPDDNSNISVEMGYYIYQDNSVEYQDIWELEESSVEDVETTEENSQIDLSFGRLLEVNDNGDVIVIKAEYDNLEKILEKSVQNVYWLVYNNPSAYSEIQFWAVANVDGETIKVISFTVNSDTIDLIANHYIATSDIEANCSLYLEDYYNITQ